MWARERKEPDGTRPGINEGLRWSQGYERVAEFAAALPATRLVYVADREADILELLVRARGRHGSCRRRAPAGCRTR
jgi:hypothetical protein